MIKLENMTLGVSLWLAVFALCWCVCEPSVGEEAAAESRLAQIVMVKKQTSNTGVVVNSEGTIALFGRRTEDGLREFTGSGTSTIRVSGPVSMSQRVQELLAGKIQYTDAGLVRSLVITSWRRGGVLVDLPAEGYKMPVLHGATVTTKTTVDTDELLMICESDVTIEVEDDCAALQAIVHLAECLLEEYNSNPTRPKESWNDYNQRVKESLQETLAAEEAMQDLELVPLVPGAKSQVSLELGPCAPLLIDFKNPGDVLGDMTEVTVERLELHHSAIEMPKSAWEAVAETWADLGEQDFWNSAAGIDDAMNGRIHEQTYLKKLIENLREAMEEACG